MKVLFVGDSPSRKNINPEVAFVGTRSYKTLLKWADEMDLSHFSMINQSSIYFVRDVHHAVVHNVAIVALGKKASKHLLDLGISHFEMGHPSGLNRQWNNPDYLTKSLKMCKMYIKRTNS